MLLLQCTMNNNALFSHCSLPYRTNTRSPRGPMLLFPRLLLLCTLAFFSEVYHSLHSIFRNFPHSTKQRSHATGPDYFSAKQFQIALERYKLDAAADTHQMMLQLENAKFSPQQAISSSSSSSSWEGRRLYLRHGSGLFRTTMPTADDDDNGFCGKRELCRGECFPNWVASGESEHRRVGEETTALPKLRTHYFGPETIAVAITMMLDDDVSLTGDADMR